MPPVTSLRGAYADTFLQLRRYYSRRIFASGYVGHMHHYACILRGAIRPRPSSFGEIIPLITLTVGRPMPRNRNSPLIYKLFSRKLLKSETSGHASGYGT